MDRHVFKQLLKYNDIVQVQQVCATDRGIVNLKIDFAYVCKLGHIDLAKFMFDTYIIDWPVIDKSIDCVCQKIRYVSNDLETIKWLLTLYGYDIYYIQGLFDKLCIHGKLIMIDYFYDLVIENSIFEVCGNSTKRSLKHILAQAARHGHLHIVQYLLEKDSSIVDYVPYAFDMACKNGKLHIVQWFISERYIDDNMMYSGMKEACSQANMHIYDWLADIHKGDVDALFAMVCQSNLAAMLHFIDKHPDVQHRNQHVAFNEACYKYRLDIARWLHSNLDIAGYDAGKILYTVCRYNNVNIVKWICSFNNLGDYIIKNRVFTDLCRDDYLELVQYMLDRYPEIDVHADNELAFRQACLYDSQATAKWLLTTYPGIDIHVLSELIFIKKIAVKHSQVIKLLLPCSDHNVSYHILNGYGYLVTAKKICQIDRPLTDSFQIDTGYVYYDHHVLTEEDIRIDFVNLKKKSAKKI